MIGLFILIPLIGYVGLWILGSVLFLIYFKLFRIELDLHHITLMLQRVPSLLAVVTVPLCSFLSFFITTKGVIAEVGHLEFIRKMDLTTLIQIGLVALVLTIVLDITITVIGEKMNILVFPVNLMYLLAWLVIVPTVIIAGR